MTELVSEEWIVSVLKTRITDMLGVEFPLMQAGMGYLARGELAAAVSNAGAFGIIGSGGNLTPDGLNHEIKRAQDLTRQPFGVNMLFPEYPDSEIGRRMKADQDERVSIVLDAGVPVLGSGLGVPPADVIRRCKSAGTLVMCTIGAVRHAVKAQEAGVDLLIAQGWEAGGHNSRVASMALLPQVERVAPVPFAAAGGIASGSGLVAALALGASAAYMGTVFAAAIEADAHDNYKRAIIESIDTSTVVTRAHSGKPARVLRNSFTDYYEAHPDEIQPFPAQAAAAEERAIAVRVHGDVQAGGAPAGQIGGLLDRSEPAAAIVERIMAEAREVLRTGLASR